jgi:hypothetical protein
MAHATLGICTLIGAMGASPCMAQTRVTTLEELRRALAAGDFITIVPAAGPPVVGRLLRLGDADLDIRVDNRRTSQERGPRTVTVPFTAIQSLERRRDSARNGAAIGAGIGAGFGGAMFAYAFAIDRNELDEWGPSYLGGAVVCAAIGALVGWRIDAAKSKPHIRFEPSAGGRPIVSIHRVYSRGRGIAVAVSLSR